MKIIRSLLALLVLFTLVSCAPVQEQETPTAEPPTAQPTAALPTPTHETTTPETAATDTAVPVIATPTDEPIATILPTVTLTVPTTPFTEGQILFFWDTETPLEEPDYYSIPVDAPKQDLYVAMPGATPSDWFIQPLLRDVLHWPNQAPNWPYAALSPDKTRVAFEVANDTDGDGLEDRNSIFLYDLRHNTVEQVIEDTHLEIFGLTWWPDNQTLAYSWGKEVFLVGTGDFLIQPPVPPFFVDVGQIVGSPDGNMLAIELQGYPSNLLLFNRSTNQLSPLIASIDLRGSHNPYWSSNSSWLAANTVIDTGLVLINATTYERTTLADDGFTFFMWSPDGSQLAFTQNTDTFSNLSVWDSATLTTTHLVERGPVDFSPPIWSPDGSQLGISFLQNGTTSLLAIEAATGASRELLQMENLYGFEPFGWSPDGQWILFFATQERGRSGLYIINQAGGEPYLILETTGTLNPYRVMWLPAE